MTLSITELTKRLTNGTVLGDWFSPMHAALDKVRFSDKPFTALPMSAFILLGGLRQLQAFGSLREQIQHLFHFDEHADKPPLARSTYSDALASPHRLAILRAGVEQLVAQAQQRLPDRLAELPGIGERPVIAIDATYQTESSHYVPVSPRDGGHDNQKGHLLLMYYNIRQGIPLAVSSETASIGEMLVLKREQDPAHQWMCQNNAIYVVDRAFIDGRYWDKRQQRYGSTVITRMKSTLKFTLEHERVLTAGQCNEGITYERQIQLHCSTQPWRLIGFEHPDGHFYEYLTNDLSLEPGVVAFLYLRRWDEEKYFDDTKNNLAGTKAWGKSPIAIEQQALLSMVTIILTKLFMQRRQADLELSALDQTQYHKQQLKKSDYAMTGNGIAYRVFYEELSKITRQIWRFLKNCFNKKHTLALYRRQLKPLMEKYL